MLNHKRPTIDDVARLAGLSTATVSRFINGSAVVSAERAAKIKAAIQELHYTPHLAAQMLASNKTRAIGLLLPTISGAFFAPVLRGVETRAIEKGYSLLVHSTQAQAQNAAGKGTFKKILAEHNTDGLLIFAASVDATELSRLHSIGFPVVLLHQASPKEFSLPAITVENKNGVRALIDHLIEDHQRRRIVQLRGPENHDDTYWRDLGYRQSLEAHGIPYEADLIETGGFNTEQARQAMRRILTRGIHFDAVFAGDDESASGAMMALREAGWRIPQDAAVVGFDDLNLAEHLTPPLTTVHSPIEQVASEAVELLVKQIGGEAVPAETLLPTYLVRRNSCGCS